MAKFIVTRKPGQWLALLAWVGMIALFDYFDWKAGHFLIVYLQTALYLAIFIAGSYISHSGLIKIKFE